ncbi:undecaprenyl-diphosphatase [Poseidonibacter parvus]|uniref:undecaprenyl-diphosphatase n=1 Tax=Poseidonibacter parvus TaxID=1850254 RepID=UPI0009FA002A|nr:undecaprenyl-diphosphatase [Poseidonibacter parvus]
MEHLNMNLFLFINSFAKISEFLDNIMITFAEYLPYLFLIIMVYTWFTNKKNETLYAGYTVILGLLINQVIGWFIYHNRPFVDGFGVTLVIHKVENSFPSDHTTFLISIALAFLIFKSSRKIGYLLFILAIIGGISRVYCGVHYPFDIIGSLVVSIMAISLIYTTKDDFNNINLFLINTFRRIEFWKN